MEGAGSQSSIDRAAVHPDPLGGLVSGQPWVRLGRGELSVVASDGVVGGAGHQLTDERPELACELDKQLA